MRLLVINFSPTNLINFLSKLMKTRIIQRVRKEIVSPNVQQYLFCDIRLRRNFQFITHFISSHMTTFTETFFHWVRLKWKKNALSWKVKKTKFIFNIVADGGEKSFAINVGKENCLQYFSFSMLSCVPLSCSWKCYLSRTLDCSWKRFFFGFNFRLRFGSSDS